jgi:hypothetical protein
MANASSASPSKWPGPHRTPPTARIPAPGADHGFLYTGGKMTGLGAGFIPAAINDNG